MRRVSVFLVVLVVSLVALAVVVAVGVAVLSSSPWSWYGMGGMMGNGGMMGGGGGAVSSSAAVYFWVAFIVLIGVVMVGVAGLAYYLAVPEIRVGAAPVVCEAVQRENVAEANAVVDEVKVGQKGGEVCTPLESVVKTLSEDERKVVDVLKAHDGKYLQKYIRGEAGLSRLQTHRVVARLAERGIVKLEKTGNTNQVLLADWLKK